MAISKKTQSLEDLNGLIAIPNMLRSDDGREFYVTRWAPVSEPDDFVRVTIDAIVRKEPEPTH